MEWEIIQRHGRPTDEQVDTSGNIYQKGGGVIPKACQDCKTEFKSTIENKPITQEVPMYKCKDCDFENPSGDAAFLHSKAHEKHEVEKEKAERIIEIQHTLVGRMAYIKILDDDVSILCELCIAKKQYGR